MDLVECINVQCVNNIMAVHILFNHKNANTWQMIFLEWIRCCDVEITSCAPYL
jgi:hypothetical protein